MKLSIVISIILTLVIGSFFVYSSATKDPCKNVGVMFLKPSERDLIPGILERNKNTIVVIPEENEIRGNSETLNCPNLDLNPYDYQGGN